ncbi:sugar phosphate isomerase/epimerase family protein [Paenibacillus sediminis]|uniref:Sugar phosphate isomerase/epimerase n=1 Tax=Paenibacillus sediminis TaxID=664909 RepID=A0ABS4GYC4_9BACL|nr:sugar phosphate isomerase/epimerase family protein [Paenibacillus sediminis]MBP1935266.1 sugar phosphate isomerase/epimerase [Paenibacillus sediminis]
MNISLSMWSVHKYWYNGSWDVLGFLDFAAATKAAGVELLSIFWRDKEKELPLVVEALKRHGLEVVCFCACNNFVLPTAEEREQQLKEITDSIDTAVHLGTRIVRVFSGDQPHDGSISYETGMQYVLEGLSAAAKYAEDNNVVLCLENHGLFAGRSDQVNDIIAAIHSPALRSTFDTGNFLLVGQSPNDAIHELIDNVAHVHVKDLIQVSEKAEGVFDHALGGQLYLSTIAGEGEVDLRFILTELYNNGYDGWLSVEFEGIEEQTEGSIRSIDYTDQLVQEIKATVRAQ